MSCGIDFQETNLFHVTSVSIYHMTEVMFTRRHFYAKIGFCFTKTYTLGIKKIFSISVMCILIHWRKLWVWRCAMYIFPVPDYPLATWSIHSINFSSKILEGRKNICKMGRLISIFIFYIVHIFKKLCLMQEREYIFRLLEENYLNGKAKSDQYTVNQSYGILIC